MNAIVRKFCAEKAQDKHAYTIYVGNTAFTSVNRSGNAGKKNKGNAFSIFIKHKYVKCYACQVIWILISDFC